MRPRSFEKYYYQRVALSESCGCAEQVINMRDLEAFAREPEQGKSTARLLSSLFSRNRRQKSS